MTDFLKLAQDAIRRGGSPRGMSFWEAAAACGVKAHEAMRKKALARAEAEALGPQAPDEAAFAPGRKLNPLVVGTLFHFLHEANADADMVWDARECAFTPELSEALRLYRAWTEGGRSVESELGLTNLSYEVDLVMPPELVGGELVTGRMDAFGQSADGTWFIVDFKTASTPGDKYTDSMQAAAYVAMAQACYPDRTIGGMYFLQAVKAKEPSFNTYLKAPASDDLERVQRLVAHGVKNLAGHGRCNVGSERKEFGSCRCSKSKEAAEKETLAAEELLAKLTSELT